MYKACGVCTYKYSCGVGSIRAGKETRKCLEPQLFNRMKHNLVWSYQQQKLQPENTVRKEENLA